MGGHGGLNILPQKRWNVYNFDNREKVRKDEEQAAKEEQLKREQSRKHDSALRIEQLRRVRGIDPVAPPTPPPPPAVAVVAESSSIATGIDSVTSKSESKSKHINLFEGIRIFDPVMVDEKKRKRKEEEEIDRRKKMRKELRERKEEVREVGPEDEVYRLGYGIAGKGVKAPWYAVKRQIVEDEDEDEDDVVVKKEKKKRTVAELREERLKREKVEKERQLALISRNGGGSYGRFSMDRERKQWRTGDRF